MCDDLAKEILLKRLENEVGVDGIHFIDSGNYHYVSALFTRLIKTPFSLVVLDHHPDMQAPMFDILSCGGWVLDVLNNNPFVMDVHIIGADDHLISMLPKADVHRVNFYSIRDIFGADVSSDAQEEAQAPAEHSSAQMYRLPQTHYPVYLSVDKDVISRDELVTNWDQGEATSEQVISLVRALAPKTIGIDICGECAPDQEDCNLTEAIRGNDDFNLRLLNAIEEQRENS
ncbi:MAG: hypothetical protein K6E91_01170 [Butyrivibrio sp.]|nr:hypothetical protein [Butyrivibrio sp.]